MNDYDDEPPPYDDGYGEPPELPEPPEDQDPADQDPAKIVFDDEDAVQLFVRGFRDQDAGDKIIAELERLGFSVPHASDGLTDDLGGIIQTNIVSAGELDAKTLADLRRPILAAVPNDPGVFVQARVWTECQDYNQ